MSLREYSQLPIAGDHVDVDGTWATMAMVFKAIETGGVVRTKCVRGRPTATIEGFARSFGEPVCLRDDSYVESVYASEMTMVSVTHHADRTGSIEIRTLDHGEYDRFVAGLPGVIEIDNPAGTIYVLISEHGDTQFRPQAIAPVPAVRENYAPDVLAAYDHVKQDLASKDPCGRITILEGEPGTGKTHLVRGLLAEVQDCVFAIVPPHMVTTFADPSFMPVVMQFARRDDGKRAVFVLEDADSALVPRGCDNIAAISTLLNMSDGILGSLVDMRLVVTTNAKKVEIDAAITRPGRMCRHIHVGKLSAAEASAVYKRITGVEKELKSMTLASIYLAARQAA